MMSRKGYPSDKQDQFMLRLPDGMRDRIKAAAEAANRSMNAEIVATLEEKYPAPIVEGFPTSIMDAIIEIGQIHGILRQGTSEQETSRLKKRLHELGEEISSLIDGPYDDHES